ARLRAAGVRVMIFTAHPNPDAVKDKLAEWGIKYDLFRRKPDAFAYIDDRAIPAGPDIDWLDEILPQALEKAFPEKAHQDFAGWQDVATAIPDAQSELIDLLLKLDLPVFEQLSSVESCYGCCVLIGPPKEQARAEEKVAVDYDGDWSRLLDPVRATVACNRLGEVNRYARRLVKIAQAAGGEVARAPKDRFRHPKDNGYRDLLYNIRLPGGVIAEVQFHLKPMLLARERSKDLKEESRSLFESAWQQTQNAEHVAVEWNQVEVPLRNVSGMRTELVMNTNWRAKRDPEKLTLFKRWLKQRVQARLRNASVEKLWRKFVAEGFKKGAGRAFDDVRKKDRALSHANQ